MVGLLLPTSWSTSMLLAPVGVDDGGLRGPPKGRRYTSAEWPRAAARGDVAQLEERCVRIAEARGSSPLISTTSLPWSGSRRAHRAVCEEVTDEVRDRHADDALQQFLHDTDAVLTGTVQERQIDPA